DEGRRRTSQYFADRKLSYISNEFCQTAHMNKASDTGTVESLKLSPEMFADEQFLEQFRRIPYVGPMKYHNDGSTYRGQMLEGKRHGRGQLVHPDGSYYDGTWLHDKK